MMLLGISFYFVKEEVCAAGGFIFIFCYKAFGLPFSYLITGDVESAYGHIKTLFLGNYFVQFENFLFNPFTFLLNAILIYLSAFFISFLFKLRVRF